jgi:hypothetical protein
MGDGLYFAECLFVLLEPEELNSDNTVIKNRVNKDDLPELLKDLDEFLDGEKIKKSFRYRVDTAKYGELWFEESVFKPEHQKDGEKYKIQSVILDITKTVEAERIETQSRLHRELRTDIWKMLLTDIRDEKLLTEKLFSLVGERLSPMRILMRRIAKDGAMELYSEWTAPGIFPNGKDRRLPQSIWQDFKDKPYLIVDKKMPDEFKKKLLGKHFETALEISWNLISFHCIFPCYCKWYF